MLDPSAVNRVSTCPRRVSFATRSLSNFAHNSSRKVSNNLRVRASLCPAVSVPCDAASNACYVTLRIASAVATTRPTSEAAVDAIFASSCACRCARVSPTGDTDRVRHGPVPDEDVDQARRASNVVFGAVACVEVPT